MRRSVWTIRSLLLIGLLVLAAGPRESGTPPTAGGRPAVQVLADRSGHYPDLQSAIAATPDGGVIELGDGRFRGPRNRDLEVSGRSLTVRSRSGNPLACVVDCGGSERGPHRGFVITGKAGGESAVTLEGITVVNGWSDWGGAALCDGATLTVRNCVFSRNTSGGGGAICCRNHAELRLIDCGFIENRSLGSGGALRCDTSGLHAFGSTFLRNAAAGVGGGVHLMTRGIRSNDSTWLPYSDEELLRPDQKSDMVLRNCTIVGNESGQSTGAVHSVFCSPRLENCVIAFNRPGRGVTHNRFSYPEFTNCCVYVGGDNEPDGFLEHQIGINGNFCQDPMLCDQAVPAMSFGIRPESPCAPNPQRSQLIGAWPVRADLRAARRLPTDRAWVSTPSPDLVAMRRRFWEVRSDYIRWRNQGWSAEIKGDFLRAEACFRGLLALLRPAVGTDHPLVVDAVEDLAYVLRERGNLGEAELLYGTAEGFWRRQGRTPRRLADNLVELAAVRSAQMRTAEAETLLLEASELRLQLPGATPSDLANDLRKLGELLVNDGRLDDGERLLARAVALQSAVRNVRCHTDLALALHGLARCARLRGDPGRAREHLREALELQRARFPSDHPLVARTLASLADCSLEMNRYTEAESLYLQAAEAFESARLRAGAGMDRATFLDSPYHHLAAARLKSEVRVGAWEAAEKAQGRALGDLTVAATVCLRSRPDAAFEESLRKAVSDREADVVALQNARPDDTTGRASRQLEEAWTELHKARGAWSSFQRDLIPGTRPEGETAYPLDRVQAALDEETALIGWVHVEFAGTAPVSAAYVIRDTGPVHWVMLLGLDGIEDSRRAMERISRYRDTLMIPRSQAEREVSLPEIAAEGHAVWSQWLAPLLVACEGVSHLVVVLSGPLLGVPLESLEDDAGVPVGQSFAVSYVPSATIHAWLQELVPIVGLGEPRQALLMGDPPFAERHLKAMMMAEGLGPGAGAEGEDARPSSGGLSDADDPPTYSESYLRSVLSGHAGSLDCLPRLPWTRVEVARIASLLPGATTLVGPAASEQVLLEMARSDRIHVYDTIHLATHALVSDEWPERSALVFSRVGLPDPLEAAARGERIYDGLVTATDVACEFRLCADLVTLSACRTALGRRTPGDGYIGLVSSFLQAGARSLLVSLWRVDDEATALLMTRFYENLTGGRSERATGPLTKAAALQEAKTWLRGYTDADGATRFRHPSCWAGFVLIGDDGRDRPFVRRGDVTRTFGAGAPGRP